MEDCKRHLEQFFVQKDKKFWEDAIMKLPEKCQKAVDKIVKTLFYKVFGENIFYFYLKKMKALFWANRYVYSDI